MENVELYNVSCHHGEFNDDILAGAVQLTDRSVLKSIYKPDLDPCWRAQAVNNDTSLNEEVSVSARKKRRTVSYVIRDMIWRLGRWKRSKTLLSFLDEVKPDVIYLPIYASPYMCDVQQFIVDRLGVPVVGHISDDVYGYPPKASPIAHRYRKGLRKKLRRLIEKCEYLEVFAENMRDEYEKKFSKPCYLIGKGVRREIIDAVKCDAPSGEVLHFVYTGNIGDERYKALSDIGLGLSRAMPGRAVLDIYSQTPLNSEMEELLLNNGAISFHGGISRAEVERVQSEADFLVHVEGFSPPAVFAARMSFSTKIIDYLTASKPIFAYGPEEVNSIAVLKSQGLGVVASSVAELDGCLAKIAGGEIDYGAITERVRAYLFGQRDIAVIQHGIYDRLNGLVD